MVAVWVNGPIVNAVVDGKARENLRRWKVRVADAVKTARGKSRFDPKFARAVTVGFSFHKANHGGHPRADLDNFIKPVLDAVAAGLFCAPDQEPDSITRWNFDDSAFGPVLLLRLSTPGQPENEGASIVVYSSARN